MRGPSRGRGRRPGWHVERETVTSALRLGGRHHHDKVGDDDPSVRVTTDALFHRNLRTGVFVARQTINGDPGIDPGRSRRHPRIIQSPYDEAVAHTHSQGWERELTRL